MIPLNREMHRILLYIDKASLCLFPLFATWRNFEATRGIRVSLNLAISRSSTRALRGTLLTRDSIRAGGCFHFQANEIDSQSFAPAPVDWKESSIESESDKLPSYRARLENIICIIENKRERERESAINAKVRGNARRRSWNKFYGLAIVERSFRARRESGLLQLQFRCFSQRFNLAIHRSLPSGTIDFTILGILCRMVAEDRR